MAGRGREASGHLLIPWDWPKSERNRTRTSAQNESQVVRRRKEEGFKGHFGQYTAEEKATPRLERGKRLLQCFGRRRQIPLQMSNCLRRPFEHYEAPGSANIVVQVNRFDSILDAEAAWRTFIDDNVGASWASEASTRYIRLNVDLGYDPPPLDAKEDVFSLEARVKKQLKLPTYETRVTEIAHRLVASAFYFVKEGRTEQLPTGAYRVVGECLPRFFRK